MRFTRYQPLLSRLLCVNTDCWDGVSGYIISHSGRFWCHKYQVRRTIIYSMVCLYQNLLWRHHKLGPLITCICMHRSRKLTYTGATVAWITEMRFNWIQSNKYVSIEIELQFSLVQCRLSRVLSNVMHYNMIVLFQHWFQHIHPWILPVFRICNLPIS